MAFDEGLADQVRKLLKPHKGLSEKKMFGGLAFLINGNMCCGVDKTEVIVRVDPDRHEEFLAKPNTREFDLSGKKSIRGRLLVTEKGCSSESSLKSWINEGVKFAQSLSPRKISGAKKTVS